MSARDPDKLDAAGDYRQRFAVFTADDGIAYLFADGKNGTHGADEMEQRIVGVVGIAIAELPALVEARQRMQAAEQDSQQRAAEGRRKAQESFKSFK